jgi:hypothetical protein
MFAFTAEIGSKSDEALNLMPVLGGYDFDPDDGATESK